MATEFRDDQGKLWVVRITIGAIKRVKEKVDVDLAQPMPIGADPGELEKNPESNLMVRLQLDSVLLGDVLVALLEVGEEFLDSLTGETFKRAKDAFWKEYEDFFRKAGQEPVADLLAMNSQMVKEGFSQIQDALKGAKDEAYEKLSAVLDGVETEIQQIDVSKTSGNTSGSQPESSGSTRRRSR